MANFVRNAIDEQLGFVNPFREVQMDQFCANPLEEITPRILHSTAYKRWSVI